MKIAYYPDTDSMYIDLRAESSAESKEVSPGVVLVGFLKSFVSYFGNLKS